MLSVSGSTSANTGTRPWYSIPMTLPMSVMQVVMTSLPGGSSSAARAMCTAAVPLEQATAYRRPYRAAKRRSNSRTLAPK